MRLSVYAKKIYFVVMPLSGSRSYMPDNHGGQPHTTTNMPDRHGRKGTKNMNTYTTNTAKSRPDFEQVKRNYETALAKAADSTQELTDLANRRRLHLF